MKFIGIIHSPFKEKFSIPRQANLIDIPMKIELIPPYNREEAIIGLSEFSHLWVLFSFHDIDSDQEQISVRPPRLGGNKQMGVFATRSPFRPNRIGMSVVKIISVNKNEIIISGGDFLDRTPIFDIKPYIKAVDSITDAKSSWTDELIDSLLEVVFEGHCENILSSVEKEIVIKILSLDPRPRYHKDQYKTYGSKIFDYDFHWKVENNRLTITNILPNLS